MKRVRDATAEILDQTTLADVCQMVSKLKDHPHEPDPMYFI